MKSDFVDDIMAAIKNPLLKDSKNKEKFLKQDIEDIASYFLNRAHEEGANEGSDYDYELGRSDGYEEGHDDGYARGYKRGFEEGKYTKNEQE